MQQKLKLVKLKKLVTFPAITKLQGRRFRASKALQSKSAALHTV